MALTCLMMGLLCAACSSPLLPDSSDDDTPTDPSLPSDSIPLTPRDSLFTVVHTGQDGDPYTVAEAQWVASASAVWVEGYVVGTVKGSLTNGCSFDAPFDVDSNILLADTFPCAPEDCLPVELPSGSLYQYALNLVDNPSLLHGKRRVRGDLTSYFRTVGVRNVTIVAEPHDTLPGTPADSTSTHSNSIDSPLSILEAIALQSSSDASSEMYWVQGYIVGWSTGKERLTVAESTAQCADAQRTNVVLTDSIGETDPARLLVVKLPDGLVRSDVNLFDNPTNLHRSLTVRGHLQPYNGFAGCVDILGASRREDLAGHPLYRIE